MTDKKAAPVESQLSGDGLFNARRKMPDRRAARKCPSLQGRSI
ncbi:hypothetical protein [Desulfovibrio sp.]|nr:hypothetical protein [Desulfovibrio sp.]